MSIIFTKYIILIYFPEYKFLCWKKKILVFGSVAQSCPTLCDPMNRSMPGLPVYHQLPEFPQTPVH